MKYQNVLLLLFTLGLGISNPIAAQIKAHTENGREVTLFNDGTWKYADEGGNRIYAELTQNPIGQFKPYSATQSLNSSHINVKVFFDPKMWEYKRITPAEAREFEFTSKWGDGKAILTTEERIVKLEQLRLIAASSAIKMVPDIRVVSEEIRKVNDYEMLAIQFEGTVDGIPQLFLGYYYSGSIGTVQFLSWGSQGFFSENRKAFTHLLNGLMIEK